MSTNQPNEFGILISRQITSESDTFYHHYDASTGRFLSEDPVRSDVENLYRYVGNRPVEESDPSGLFGGPGMWLSNSSIPMFQEAR